MPRIAGSSMFFHDYELDDIFDFTDNAGMDTMEFWIETPAFWLNGTEPDVLQGCLEKHPGLLPINMHAAVLDLNPCSINPHIAEVSVMYAIRAIEMAEELHADVLTLHPGRRTTKRKAGDADFRRLRHYLDEIQSAASTSGVRISIENMENRINSVVSTPSEMKRLLDDYPSLWFTFDIAHALLESEKTALKFIECCYERIANVHASGCNAESVHIPVSMDEGAINILGQLKGLGYDGVITLELDDLTFGRPLSAGEKVSILAKERQLIDDLFS